MAQFLLSFGCSTSPGDTARQQNWRAWVACEGVDLAGVVEEVTFTVQTERAHAVKAPPYQLVRTSTVQGNHNQELQAVLRSATRRPEVITTVVTPMNINGYLQQKRVERRFALLKIDIDNSDIESKLVASVARLAAAGRMKAMAAAG